MAKAPFQHFHHWSQQIIRETSAMLLFSITMVYLTSDPGGGSDEKYMGKSLWFDLFAIVIVMPFTSRNIVFEMFSTQSQATFSGGRNEKIKLSGGAGLPRKLLPLRLSKTQKVKGLLSPGVWHQGHGASCRPRAGRGHVCPLMLPLDDGTAGFALPAALSPHSCATSFSLTELRLDKAT